MCDLKRNIQPTTSGRRVSNFGRCIQHAPSGSQLNTIAYLTNGRNAQLRRGPRVSCSRLQAQVSVNSLHRRDNGGDGGPDLMTQNCFELLQLLQLFASFALLSYPSLLLLCIYASARASANVSSEEFRTNWWAGPRVTRLLYWPATRLPLSLSLSLLLLCLFAPLKR